MPPRELSVDIGRDNVALGVRSWDGAGPPFLLVHGLASNAKMWDGVAELLAATGARVVTVDQRGHGQSSKPDGPYDTATVVGDLVALIGALALERPIVAGQSWGGNVVLQLGYDHPELVAAIAGIDGGLIELQAQFPDWEQCRRALAPPPLAGTLATDLERMIRNAHPAWPETGIRGVLGCFETRADGTVAPWLTLERHLLVLRGLWEHHPMALLDALAVPALVVHAVDPAQPEWTATKRAVAADAARRQPALRLAWLDGHHDLHAEQPAAVTRLLAELAASAS